MVRSLDSIRHLTLEGMASIPFGLGFVSAP
jgi:hypothetical protein